MLLWMGLRVVELVHPVHGGMTMLKGSWKTSAAGISLIVAAIATAVSHHFDADPATVADWTTVIGLVVGGIAAIFARDNNVKSETVGAK